LTSKDRLRAASFWTASTGGRSRFASDRGNRLELPWLSGKVVEFGRQLGVPTPTHSMMYAMLKPYIMGASA
jgi:ketopantoate reductase